MDTPFGEIPDRFVPDMSMAERHDFLTTRLSRRRLLRAALAGSAAAVAGPVLWQRPGIAAVAPTAPRLTYGADPMRELVVSWSTAGPVERPLLELGVDDRLGLAVPVETKSVAGTGTLSHHARLTGLEPGRAYRYRLSHRGGTSPIMPLATAPAEHRPFTFTTFGDQGVSAGAVEITRRAVEQRPAFQFHVGDLCYAYGGGGLFPGPVEQDVWDQWLDLISPLASTVPWMPALGNHEMETGYGPQGYGGVLSRFTLPTAPGLPGSYAIRYGNLGLVALDANDVSHEIAENKGYTGGVQTEWLRRTLRELRADPDIDWIVVGFHHCAYSTNIVHASEGGVREQWVPLFDEAGVDLVVNGHNHCYERTNPIRQGILRAQAPRGATIEPARDGTVYVTAGGGGQTAYQGSLFPASYVTREGNVREPESADWSAVRHLDLSLLAVDIAPADATGRTTLTLRGLTAQGQEIDRLTLARTRNAVVAEPETPPARAAQPGSQEEPLPATGGGAGALLLGGAAAAAGIALRRA